MNGSSPSFAFKTIIRRVSFLHLPPNGNKLKQTLIYSKHQQYQVFEVKVKVNVNNSTPRQQQRSDISSPRAIKLTLQ
jgi:hypothetical protein